MYENNKDIGWKKKNNNSSNGSYDDSLIKNQINILDKKIEDKQNELDVSINKIKMIAHRGFSSQAPENTIPSYELAGMKNYWGAECDVLETSDGHFVLMHDNTVDRTTNGTGSVYNMTLEQIKALTVDINADYNNVKVPTLEEYLICCKKYSLVPVIEIKLMIDLERFLNAIKEYDYENSCMVISFNNDVLKGLRALSKNIKLQTLNFVSIEECVEYDFDIDISISDITEELVKDAHNNGLKVNVWTVDDKQVMDNLINMNVDYITTNILTVPNQVTTSAINELKKNIDNTQSFIGGITTDGNTIKNDTIVGFENVKFCSGKGAQNSFPNNFRNTTDDYATVNRAFTNKLYPVGDNIEEIISVTIKQSGLDMITVVFFDENLNQLADLGWFTVGTKYTAPPNSKYCCLYVGSGGARFFDAHLDLLQQIEFVIEYSTQKENILATKSQTIIGSINELMNKFNSLGTRIDRIYELINNLHEEEEILEEEIISPTSLVYGRAPGGNIVYPTGYEAYPDDYRAYVPQQIFVEDGYKYEIITTSDICVTLHPFGEDNKRIKDYGWLSNGTSITPEDEVHYFIIYIKMTDESSIKDNEDHVLSTVKIVKSKVN